jgi:hypothetical protein
LIKHSKYEVFQRGGNKNLGLSDRRACRLGDRAKVGGEVTACVLRYIYCSFNKQWRSTASITMNCPPTNILTRNEEARARG